MEWPLLSSLSEQDRRDVLATARRRSFGRNEVVVHEGDPADSLHLVAAGRLAVRVTTRQGDNAMLAVLGRGDYFGELALLDGRAPRRTATVVALEPAETLSLSADAFRDLRQRHRGAEQLLMALLARRVEELSDRLVGAMYDSLDLRVHRRLAELVEVYATSASGAVAVPLTQEHVAELVGGTRPSVNQVLQRLVAAGVVELGRGRITVLDRAWLARRSA